MGIRTTKTWTARMVNTRDSHAALNGKTVYENEKFTTIWGNDLAYPGDPAAPAREVINCHCVMVPGVELPGDKKQENVNQVFTRPFENGKMEVGTKIHHAGQVVTFSGWDGAAQTIAGKNCRRKIDEIDGLVAQFGGHSKDWQKKKRWARGTINGVSGCFDVHWYEEPTVGKVKGKIKYDPETFDWFYPDS